VALVSCRVDASCRPVIQKLCKDHKNAIPSCNDRLAFLANAEIPAPSPATNPALNERCATLAWVRRAVSTNIDPDTWPTLIDGSLLPCLSAQYALPPARAADCPISDFARLARAVTVYFPDDPAAVGPAQQPQPQLPPQPPPRTLQPPQLQPQHQQPPTRAGPTIRTAGTSPPPQAAAPSIIVIPDPPTWPLTGSKRKAWMMCNELSQCLPEAVYSALDTTVGLSAADLTKVLSACKKNDIGSLLDNTTFAAFCHQFIPALHDGAHFDVAKRGLALAAAGRSAHASSQNLSAVFDLLTRDVFFIRLKSSWPPIEQSFRLPTELSGTAVNILWNGVSVVFQLCASRAESWGPLRSLRLAAPSWLPSQPTARPSPARSHGLLKYTWPAQGRRPSPRERCLCLLLRSLLVGARLLSGHAHQGHCPSNRKDNLGLSFGSHPGSNTCALTAPGGRLSAATGVLALFSSATAADAPSLLPSAATRLPPHGWTWPFSVTPPPHWTPSSAPSTSSERQDAPHRHCCWRR
jgi:hypothetical protein